MLNIKDFRKEYEALSVKDTDKPASYFRRRAYVFLISGIATAPLSVIVPVLAYLLVAWKINETGAEYTSTIMILHFISMYALFRGFLMLTTNLFAAAQLDMRRTNLIREKEADES